MRKAKTNRTQRRNGVCLVALVAVVLVALPAVPAAADHSPAPASPVAGSGTLHGTELEETQVFLGQPCFAAARHVYGLQGEGSYYGRTAEGQEVIYRAQLAEGQPVHEGPLQVQVENTEPFHHGPNGTHGGDSTCSTATAGTPVPASFRIFAAEGVQDTDGDNDVDILTGTAWVYRLDDTGAQVPCTGQGSFVRTASGQNWHAEWTLSEDCTVIGNAAGTPGQGIAPAFTAHTHLGSHGPCGGDCVDNFKVDYKQYPPVPGLAVGVAGPSHRVIGQTATVTAGVTNDGAPVSGAAVTFSVTGPGPATPAGGPALTGDDGRASFSFTAGVEGDYTVTASVTELDRTASGTHVVRFALPAPAMTLSGLRRSQTEDPVVVVATVVDENAPFDYDADGDPRRAPIPGVTVEFAVSGAGQATPASGSSTTDTMGRASFTFTGDGAGDYTVSASATYLGEEASATHTARLDARIMSRVGAIDVSSSDRLGAAVIDPAGDFAYFGTTSNALVKVDLATFERVATIDLDGGVRSAVIDPAGSFAYFGTSGSPGKVVKVDLATFQRVGAITLASGENTLSSAVIDPAGAFAYFGTDTFPVGRVVKVDLATFQRVGAIAFPDGVNRLRSAVIDPAGKFAYFGSGDPGRVVKVDLSGFQAVGAVTLPDGERWLTSAAIDPAGTFAYFGTAAGGTDRLVKIDVATLQRVGSIPMPDNVANLTSAVMDPAGNFAYFGATVFDTTALWYSPLGAITLNPRLAYAAPTADGVVKVDLNAFELAHVLALSEGEENPGPAVIDPDGTHAYFGTSFSDSDFNPVDDIPTKVVKLSLTRPPAEGVRGAAYGYYSKVSLFGGPSEPRGPAPTVALAADASNSPQDAHVEEAAAVYGPAVIFRSGPIDVHAEGAVGAAGYASASSNVQGHPDPNQRPGPFLYDGVNATCRADGNDTTASVAITNGVVETSYHTGDDPNTPQVEEGGDVKTTEAVPAKPPPGYTVEGTLDHIGDRFRIVFNEQRTDPDGSRVVTGAHMYLLGPTAVGDLFIAQAVCGVVLSAGDNAAPTAADDAYTTGQDNALVVPAPGVLANDTDPDGDALSAGSASDAAHGTVTLNRDGSFTYTPEAGFTGTDSFDYVVTDSRGKSDTATVNVTVEAAPPEDAVPVVDFDGDAKSDVGVYRPGPGVWYLRQSSGGDTAAAFGAPGDVATPADYDGDGKVDIAVYRPSSGVWYLRQSSAGDTATAFGTNGDVPMVGDYDGDAKADVAVYRPTTGVWYLRQSSAGDTAVAFGTDGDIPVVGDYDGDGKADVAVYRPSTGVWYLRQSTAGDTATAFGTDGDIPTVGDYDGDAKADIALYRPTTGIWYLRQSSAGDTATVFGTNGDVPAPADYDGDGKTDVGVFRPSTGVWYLRQSTAGETATVFGTDGDVALPLPAAVHQRFFAAGEP